jgi:hypothetical protein
MTNKLRSALAGAMATLVLCTGTQAVVVPQTSNAASTYVEFKKANTYYKLCRVKLSNKRKDGYIKVSHTAATTSTKFTVKLAGNRTTWSGSYYYNGLQRRFRLGTDNSYYNVYGKSSKKYTNMWVKTDTNTYFG